ncbi:type I glyceraldehyde-3-phosphate dehydrogenase [Desulfuromonas acetoxidans]|uniref:Glyceraldehyde-3-phosphate dehydrogenase n=1 Tax=Desulfuromonas acetoxidans (strain DSM 684 / 11070) TaxID=281689 RepID=Q1JZ48_DESA6|nr:type I glyceraldehyde-3-phosphate dehydrogenase [Desulfuromonas acetoxidans]EAT15446.1 glyceraldehyde-3-phosphate dehydrogenase, type I [Desulfuromonas acetoxidans DSM 684]MBF0646728.1 type I glyceraldehyde-3-phosphate dehydrogenase [Desulfuromonas acetoxidans]NVD25900.1 type I glyceraldehyde-3-phosphate dehydrogenase [Desulfuromonas acetoxidans]NVE17834.1 type I glyceraldehyde-3-phosphate dehydrogenase [Desulfuromonas acetoxidans]
MATKVAINGFGRIGRNVLRIAQGHPDFNIVAINDLTDAPTLAHLLKYDSVHGTFAGEVKAEGDTLYVNGQAIKITCERDPENLPWQEMDVEIVVESTGRFRKREDAAKHLTAGAKKVLISAPGKNSDVTVVRGVNFDQYDPAQHDIISNASCTTNCLAPVAKLLLDSVGIERGSMTTIHSYTNDQRILDLPHEDLRRARAASLSMIPTTTGATKAVGQVLPGLKGKLTGLSVRVPTPNVSLIDLVIETEKPTSVEAINALMAQAADGPLKGVLEYCDEPLVSIDFNGHPASAIFDSLSTTVMDETLVKVLLWYDNEWGYSARVVDLISYVARS